MLYFVKPYLTFKYVIYFFYVCGFVILMMYESFAKAYGRGALFALGLLLLPFIFAPILGFGNAQYVRID